MKTEISINGFNEIQIKISMHVLDVLDLEKHFDRLLDNITNRDTCSILYGGEMVLRKFGLKLQRLVADDGSEHYFLPDLHKLIEKQDLPTHILRMGAPLSINFRQSRRNTNKGINT